MNIGDCSNRLESLTSILKGSSSTFYNRPEDGTLLDVFCNVEDGTTSSSYSKNKNNKIMLWTLLLSVTKLYREARKLYFCIFNKMLKLELLGLIALIWWSLDNIHAYGAVENIQTNLLSKGCSAYNASNLHSFFANINETFAGLRAQISSDKNKRFAIEDKARGEVIT
ncbi:hypothetical protein V8G54_016942 [Vigna mungo]|uniref:Uncharacterized protein n=1 Tax=Vigna mungo TaxID=3915 RepID=A0AAQ3NPR4_VIGMU